MRVRGWGIRLGRASCRATYLQLRDRNLPWGVRGTTPDDNRPAHNMRIHDRPFQCLHAAHGSTNYASYRIHAQVRK